MTTISDEHIPEKRLPYIVGRTVWEKITKGPAGTRWDNLIQKIWQCLVYEEIKKR